MRSEHIDRSGNDKYVDGAKPFKTVENMTNVVGVDFDYKQGKLYFTQIRPRARIAWMDSKNPRNGEGIHDILTKRVNPEGIAFDWVHQKIYWRWHCRDGPRLYLDDTYLSTDVVVVVFRQAQEQCKCYTS